MTQAHRAPVLEMSAEQLRACLDRVQGVVSTADYAILEALLGAYLLVRQALLAARVSVARLKQLFFGPKSEKSRDVLSKTGQEGSPASPDDKKLAQKGKTKGRGHGRLGAADYPGAVRIGVHDGRFFKGCPCPDEYCRGKLYLLKQPLTILRLFGQAPLAATIWEQDRWRCNDCEEIFHARLPPEARGPKYDASAVAMIALMHYGNGFAYHRLARCQSDLGIPVPASDQSELLKAARDKLLPVFNELRRQAAQVDLLHNDDTGNRVLALQQKKRNTGANTADGTGADRTGIYTTAIVAITATYKIALYATGRKHAGENLTELLELRAPGLAPPQHMSDGLDHNRPAEPIQTIEGKCLTHGRRQFVDIASSFPEESRRVLEALREVYRVDAIARTQNLSPRERLLLHQGKSEPVMDRLRRWLVDQLLGNDVEPNSSLGKAIQYLLKRWGPLTLFLREPGAPLDNNIAERVLKLAIRHRRNSLFFKTTGGAAVGDLFTSFIATCQLNRVNAFEYLTALLMNAGELAANPGAWMPWNYQAGPAVQAPSTANQPLPRPDGAAPRAAVSLARATPSQALAAPT